LAAYAQLGVAGDFGCWKLIGWELVVGNLVRGKLVVGKLVAGESVLSKSLNAGALEDLPNICQQI
jgi:hypothetical protein